MAGNISAWTKLLFDGAGGTLLAGLVGFLYHKVHSKKKKNRQTNLQTIVTPVALGDTEASENSVAFGAGASLRGSPVVYGDHNVFNIHPPKERADRDDADKREEEEEEEEEDFENLSSLAGTLLVPISIFFALLLVAGGTVYFAFRESNASHKTAAATPISGMPSNVPTASRPAKTPFSAGIQYGQNISSISVEGFEETDCTEKGITCLGEQEISGKTITIPLQRGADWSRIALLISSTDYAETIKVVASTESDEVGLNYVGHRDGSFHKQIEFTTDYVNPISESQSPLWFPIDITFRKLIRRFPLTVTVSEYGVATDAVTTHLRIIRPRRADSGGSH